MNTNHQNLLYPKTNLEQYFYINWSNYWLIFDMGTASGQDIIIYNGVRKLRNFYKF